MSYKVKTKNKKKRIYSKTKEPVLITEKTIENPLQMVSEVFNIKNVWVDFIDKAIYKEEKIDSLYSHDLRNIMEHIKDNSLKSKIFEELMKIKTYNPFTDEIPLDELSENNAKLISKIIAKLQDKEYIIQHIFKNKIGTLTVDNIEHSYIIAFNISENINKELFKSIDISITINNGTIVISSNPKLDRRPNFQGQFQILEQIEPNVWYLHGNKGILKTQRNKVSTISVEKLMFILWNIQL